MLINRENTSKKRTFYFPNDNICGFNEKKNTMENLNDMAHSQTMLT